MKTKILRFSNFAGIMLAVLFYFNNCGQVEFGTTNQKPTEVLEVDPGNNGQDVPPINDDPITPDDPKYPPTGDPGDDGHPWNGHHSCKKSCGNNGIKDIVVNIDHIEIRGTHGEILTLTGDLGETSIIGGSLPIFVSEDIDIVSIRLVLKDSGNYIIDDNNKTFNLKTPSGQQSGLKIPFQGMRASQGGAYNLKFRINPETQIVKAGKKCLLKPVLHFISFESI